MFRWCWFWAIHLCICWSVADRTRSRWSMLIYILNECNELYDCNMCEIKICKALSDVSFLQPHQFECDGFILSHNWRSSEYSWLIMYLIRGYLIWFFGKCSPNVIHINLRMCWCFDSIVFVHACECRSLCHPVRKINKRHHAVGGMEFLLWAWEEPFFESQVNLFFIKIIMCRTIF